jgi:hypothetical protein
MKQPDQSLLTQHRILAKTIANLEDTRTALTEKIRKARKELDEFTKKHGDMEAKQAGFERHQAWLNQPKSTMAELNINSSADDWIESMSGILWEKVENGTPIPFIEVFEIFHPDIIGPLEFGQFRPNATLADLVVRLGLFPSLTEARKAGHVKPLEPTEEIRFKNGKLGIKRVKVIEFNETRQT